ncbi:MAG: flagellar biosynthetic protein FliR [Candidatus Poribacteria bacterium]|nr:flagellar biosynthetic protein FliR [Candidatus Poribacteria bacterium]
MELFDITTITAFMLVVFRIGSLMAMAPFFGPGILMTQFKIGFSVAVAALVFPLLDWQGFVVPTTTLGIGLLIAREVLVGIVIGFVADMIFAGAQLAGQLISFQMGLALATIFDPISGMSNSIISMVYRWLALMIFLAVNGHHWLLQAIVDSYQLIGFGEASFNGAVLNIVLYSLRDLFRIAIQITAPATVVLFFTNSLLAVVGRAIPQMHIFLVGLPLTLSLGFFVLAASLGGVAQLFPLLFVDLRDSLGMIIEALAS